MRSRRVVGVALAALVIMAEVPGKSAADNLAWYFNKAGFIRAGDWLAKHGADSIGPWIIPFLLFCIAACFVWEILGALRWIGTLISGVRVDHVSERYERDLLGFGAAFEFPRPSILPFQKMPLDHAAAWLYAKTNLGEIKGSGRRQSRLDCCAGEILECARIGLIEIYGVKPGSQKQVVVDRRVFERSMCFESNYSSVCVEDFACYERLSLSSWAIHKVIKRVKKNSAH